MLCAKIKKKVLRNEFTCLDCDIYCSWLKDPSRITSIFSRIDRFIILLEENLSKILRGKNVTIPIHIFFFKTKISLKPPKERM